jgi:hypothetical protein
VHTRLDKPKRAKSTVLGGKAPLRPFLGHAVPEHERPDAEGIAKREQTHLTACGWQAGSVTGAARTASQSVVPG